MEHETSIQGDGLAIVELSRPQCLNALSLDGFSALADEFEALGADRAVAAVLLTGHGRAFCAGADLQSLAAHFSTGAHGGIDPEIMRSHFDSRVNRLLRAMTALPQPLVCAVNGIASGGGVGLALAGDLVLAARSAAFHLPFGPRLGIIPDAGASWLVTRAMGPAGALAAMLTAELIPAQRALDLGLVWRVEDDEALMSVAASLARQMAALPAGMKRRLRETVERAHVDTFDRHLDHERDVNSELVDHPDFMEGVAAFREKRAAVFKR